MSQNPLDSLNHLDNASQKLKPSLVFNPNKEYRTIEEASVYRYHLNVSELFSKAWERTKGFKLDFFLGTLLYGAIGGASLYFIAMIMGFLFIILYIGFMAGAVNGLAMNNHVDFLMNSHEVLSLGVFLIYGAYLALIMIAAIPINIVGIGLLVMAQKRVNFLKVDLLKDLFAGFKLFWRLLFLQLSVFLLYMIGLLFFILPGIYLVIASSLAVPLALAYPNRSITDLMTTSWKIVNQHFFKIAGIYLLLIIINFIAAIPLGIGLIWSLPWSYLVMVQLLQNVMEFSERTDHSSGLLQ